MLNFRALLYRYITINPFRWRKNANTMKRLVSAFPAEQNQSGSTCRAAVVIIPWLATDVPWFSIVMGLFWQRRRRHVEFIIDDMPFGKNPIRFAFILWCIRTVTNVLRPRFRVISLKSHASSAALSDDQQVTIDRMCTLNAIWELKGESKVEGRREYESVIRQQLAASYRAINSLLETEHYDSILVPGGVYNSSGIWSERARYYNTRVASFDSGGKGLITFAVNGIASQLHDIPASFAMLKSSVNNEAEKQFVIEKAKSEIEQRQRGKDRFAYQVVPSEQKQAQGCESVLIALNSSWDSAALGLHIVFNSTTEWLLETTQWILTHTNSSVIIRQHPVERLAVGRSNDDYAELLEQNFGTIDRVRFIAAADPVNSYDLMRSVTGVVVYTSTIGVEATILGKVVVTPSKSYYSKLGFVWNAETKDEYFEHIKCAIDKTYIVDEDKKNDALLCYYITQCCNWISTPLSPEGFDTWSTLDFSELYEHEAVQLTVKALDSNIPTSFLQHERHMQINLNLGT